MTNKKIMKYKDKKSKARNGTTTERVITLT